MSRTRLKAPPSTRRFTPPSLNGHHEPAAPLQPFVNGQAAANGRETNGRFARGNGGGPGNPFARKVAALRSALFDAVTADDVRRIARRLVRRARAGELAAIKLLFTYILGKPTEAADPDRLDLNELDLVR